MKNYQLKLLIVSLALLLVIPYLNAQINQQAQCSRIVAKNIETTKNEKPDIFVTIAHYTFEWSRKYQSCVMIIQYKVSEKGQPPELQILAINAVTLQPMEGTKNIYLIAANDQKDIDYVTNSLIEKYSH